MKLKNIGLGVCAAMAAAFTPLSVKANTLDEHSQLFGAIQSAGVNVVINSPSVCDSETAGAYASRHRVMFVCQENASAPYLETTWTPYDLDTLRHEAHHMVQDCLAGRIADERYEPLFDNEYDFEEFIRANLTQEEIDWILEAYADEDPQDILIELESFAVAKSVSPITIAEAIQEACVGL